MSQHYSDPKRESALYIELGNKIRGSRAVGNLYHVVRDGRTHIEVTFEEREQAEAYVARENAGEGE